MGETKESFGQMRIRHMIEQMEMREKIEDIKLEIARKIINSCSEEEAREFVKGLYGL